MSNATITHFAHPVPVAMPCARQSEDAKRRQSMNVLTDAVRLPTTNDSIAPVRILDADGHPVCVVSADEFRRSHPIADTTDSTSTAPGESFSS
jgi:hypothetical protein